jgi:hypothetical protein
MRGLFVGDFCQVKSETDSHTWLRSHTPSRNLALESTPKTESGTRLQNHQIKEFGHIHAHV